MWLYQLARELNNEYRYRYEHHKDHKSIGVLNQLSGMTYERKGLTIFAQVMPEEYKIENDPVQAYRTYYRKEKMGFAKWTRREIPSWIQPDTLRCPVDPININADNIHAA